MKQDLPETRALYRIGPVMREALLSLAQTGAHRSRRALARPVAREAKVGLRTALYAIAHLVEMGLVLDDPVRLSDVGRRYVERLLRGAPYAAAQTVRVAALAGATASSAPPSARAQVEMFYDRCPACGAPAGVLVSVPPPRSDPGYRAVRCARCWSVFAR